MWPHPIPIRCAWWGAHPHRMCRPTWLGVLGVGAASGSGMLSGHVASYERPRTMYGERVAYVASRHQDTTAWPSSSLWAHRVFRPAHCARGDPISSLPIFFFFLFFSFKYSIHSPRCATIRCIYTHILYGVHYSISHALCTQTIVTMLGYNVRRHHRVT